MSDASSQVRTTQEGMRKALNIFADYESRLNGIMVSVNNEVNELASYWQGNVAHRFGQVMGDWNDQVKLIIRDLRQLHQNVEATMKGQVATDQANEDAVNSLGNSDPSRGEVVFSLTDTTSAVTFPATAAVPATPAGLPGV